MALEQLELKQMKTKSTLIVFDAGVLCGLTLLSPQSVRANEVNNISIDHFFCVHNLDRYKHSLTSNAFRCNSEYGLSLYVSKDLH